MAKLTFKGGIHPHDGKDLSKNKPIKEVLPKGDLVYPLSQHIGAPANSLVKKGDRVLAGQKIADGTGFVSASVFSAVSGVVKGIEPKRVASGERIDSIIIENDGLYEKVEFKKIDNLKETSREEIIDRIKEAGIVGMGGAGFPAHVKLSPKEPDKIEYIIINGAECEPYLTSDYRRMLEEPEHIIDGIKVLLKLFHNAKGIIAIEDNKPECIEKLKKMVKTEPGIVVKVVKTKYPQGGERQLIYATTGRSIHSGMLPADVGCIVQNVDTVVAIYNGVINGTPLLERIVTVTGDAIADPCNLKVKIGTSYEELIEEAGGFKHTPAKIISGGPMMGIALFDTKIPVTKTSSALLCFSHDEVSKWEPSACINCGKCLEICPGRVMPSKLATFATHDQEDKFIQFEGMECCECGCCSFVCPAKRPLAQSIKSMRRMILSNRKK